jgi:putative FmdB family regulatory protein
MPIFEFICDGCQEEFDVLVMGEKVASCPKCQGENLTKKLSVFSVGTRSSSPAPREMAPAGCGSCGDPRGPGACKMD